jgi:23S rRNA (uracil1939-C5)-methyltransferase
MKVKKSYGYARLLKLLEPSPARTEPLCPVARQCGGCQLQHMKYEEQLRYKENKIKECLKRIGGIDPSGVKFEPIIGMEKPFYYRNKAQFPVGKNRAGELVTGFFAGRTHTIIDTSHCYIQAEINEKLLSVVRDFLIKEGIEPYDEETHSGLIRHILTRVGFATKEIMVCLIINGDTLPKADRLVEELKKIDGMTSICININREKTNVILGKECKVLWGQGYITDRIGDVKYQISPLSFYQVNPRQTKRLYDTALEYANLTGEEIVWDLYCGIGTISLFLAQHAKQVYGVEIVEQAVLDARENKKINGIQNAEFFTGAAEEVMPQKYKESNGSMKAQVIVVDPPRKGCDERLLETIAAMTPERIVYVSCDPATLARDVKYLGEKGYRLERVRGCDMFGQSVHVETVVLLTKVYK